MFNQDSGGILSREWLETVLFKAGYWFVAILMLLPLVVVVISSFGQAETLVKFPPSDFGVSRYNAFIDSPTWVAAVANSLITSTGTALLSTFLGVTAALGMEGIKDRQSQILMPIILLPLFLPPVVLGVVLLIYLDIFGIYQSYIGIIIAHSLWGTPLVFFIMQAVFSQFSWDVKEAAMDLHASPLRAFYEVVYPGIKNGLLAAVIISFIVSLQEFIMALFLSGPSTVTTPVVAWNKLRQALDPAVSVMSTIFIAGPLIALIILTVVFGLDRVARNV